MAFEKILVITQLDELSTTLMRFATNIASQLGIHEIILLNIIVPVHSQAFTAMEDFFHADEEISMSMNQMLHDKNQDLIRQQAHRFSSGDISIRPQVAFSHSRTDLNQFLEESGADLLISGSYDEQHYTGRVSGTRAEKLAYRVDYPMIIVHGNTPINTLDDIVVAIDIDNPAQSGLDRIITFAQRLDAKLHLLHVITRENSPAQLAIEKLRLLARHNCLTNYSINVITNHNLENGLHRFIKKYNPDMVAVLSRGKGKIKRLIYGSSTEDIVEGTEIPVFISKMNI